MTTTTTTDPPARLALHPGQAAVYRALRRVEDRWINRFRVVVAGRRWGKTHLARTELLARALTFGPGRYWYVAPTLKAAKDMFWEDLKAACDPTWQARGPNESELSIDLRNGAELRIHGAEDPDALRGRGLRFVVLDEYADMRPETWSTVLRPSLADHKAPALFIGTPKTFNHFHELFERGQSSEPRWSSWWSLQAKSSDNPTLDPAEIADARATTDPRTFRQEYEASFEAMGGRAYYAFSRLLHRRPVTLERAVPMRISFDFNVQPATAVLWQRVGEEARAWREVWVSHAGGEATRASAQRAAAYLREVGWTGPVVLYGDATGRAGKTTGPSDHAVLREVFPGAQWRIGKENPHVRDRVASVNGRCLTQNGETHLLVDPACEHLISDLEQVTFSETTGDLDQKTNRMLTHISDALGYGIHAEWPAAPVSAVSSIRVPAYQPRTSQAVAAMRAAKTARLRAELAALHV